MNLFKYIALETNGEKKKGIILASNLSGAYQNVRNKFLLPVSISRVYKVSSKINLEEILMFFLHIEFQLKCGVKINDAIDSFIDCNQNKILNVKLIEISESLKKGKSLTEAFENSIFDKTIVGLINAAEKTGNISEVINNILAFLKLENEWRDKVKSVLAYPLFILVMSVAITWFCLSILGPQVVSLTQNYNFHDFSNLTNFTLNYFPIFGGALIVILVTCFFGFMVFSFSKKMKGWVVNQMLKIPKVGDILLGVSIWQFCNILQIALSAKLDFVNSMSLAIEGVYLDEIKKDFMRIKTKILSGYKIFEAFSESRYISQMLTTAIYVGETGNSLPQTFSHISTELYHKIISQLKKLGQELSVILTLTTGCIFILILYSLFYPLYNYVEIAQ